MSALFTWNDTYSVKVSSLDKQHQKIFEIANKLHDAMGTGKGQEQVKTVLRELVDYTATHLTSEEAILEKQGYPNLAAHRTEHKALLEKVHAFQKEYEAGKIGMATSLMNFIVDWLKKHIQQTDKGYSQFLNDHGLR